jgi:hypothetical protein
MGGGSAGALNNRKTGWNVEWNFASSEVFIYQSVGSFQGRMGRFLSTVDYEPSADDE